MRKRSLSLGLATSAVAAALIGAAVFSTPAIAAPPADNDAATLHEFRTATDQGWFYTLDANEAAKAQSKYHFKPSATFGRMHRNGGTGRTAVHRLRLKSAQSYMLSIDQHEIHLSQFVDEGIMGYIDDQQHEGEQKLLRFSNHGQWRVLSDAAPNIKGMTAQGYRVDGPMGWA